MERIFMSDDRDKKAAQRRKTEGEAESSSPPCPKDLATAERKEAVDQAEATVEAIDEVLDEQGQVDMDELVEEIDAVLEENCEQFVKDFVQRGGE